MELVRSAGNPHVITSVLARRGERGHVNVESQSLHFGISHLFSNRDLRRAMDILAGRADSAGIQDRNDRVADFVQKPRVSRADLGYEQHSTLGEEVVPSVNWENVKEEFRTGIALEGYMTWPRRIICPRHDSGQPVQFIRTSGMSPVDTMRLFDDIVLSENEEHGVQSSQSIDTAIERTASVIGKTPVEFISNCPE